MPKITIRALLFAAVGMTSVYGVRAAEYTLMPTPQTVHFGYFSAA
jgi:hypothetical protein